MSFTSLIAFAEDSSSPVNESAYDKVVYVSPTGNNETATGEAEAPFYTLAAARDYVRTINGDGKNIAVVLRGGQYNLGSTFTLGTEDGGQGSGSVTYMSYPGETVVVDGGERVTGWSETEESGLYKASLDINEVRQLWVNGSRAQLARSATVNEWNELLSWDKMTKTIKVYASDVEGISECEIVVHMSWAVDIMRVQAVLNDENDTSVKYLQLNEFDEGVIFGRSSPFKTDYQHYYLQNAKELLDREGEFWYDEENKELYYRPRLGEDLATAEVVVPYIDTLVDIQGESEDNPVKNLTIKGINFRYSAFDGTYRYGFTENQANHYPVYRSGSMIGYDVPTAAVQAQCASGIKIDRCAVTRCGGSGIVFRYSVFDSEIIGCTISDMSASGIMIAPSVNCGDLLYEAQTRGSNILVANNYVNWIGMDYYGAIGILNCYGSNVVIRNNEIAYCSYTGVSVGWGWSTREIECKDNIVAYNDIHHTSMFVCDTAAIYTLSAQRGTQIRNNYVHDVMRSKFVSSTTPAYGIYLDEGSNYMVVTDNVIRNTNEDEYLVFTHQSGLGNYIAGNKTSDAEIEAKAGVNKYYAKTVPGELREGSFVRNMALGHIVNATTGEVGFAITPKKDITVTAIGRFYVSGNNEVHKLKIIDAETGNVVASTSVDMRTAKCDGSGFKYGELSGEVVLSANKEYYVVSEERCYGDLYLDKETNIIFDETLATVSSYVLKKDGLDNYLPAKKLADKNMGGLNLIIK